MKKSIILGCLFLAAVSFSAQEKGQKNTTPIKNTKGTIVNPIKPAVFNKEAKPAPVVKVTPVAEVKYQTSKTRTTSTKVNTNRPEKVTNNRAASSSVNTSKAEKSTNNRAASQSVINTMNVEKEVIVEESTKTKKEKPSRKERKSKK
tara:strand:+ start:380 stop:820 length:441 start_codon:yes stop_codon:yes gene_type:complete